MCSSSCLPLAPGLILSARAVSLGAADLEPAPALPCPPPRREDPATGGWLILEYLRDLPSPPPRLGLWGRVRGARAPSAYRAGGGLGWARQSRLPPRPPAGAFWRTLLRLLLLGALLGLGSLLGFFGLGQMFACGHSAYFALMTAGLSFGLSLVSLVWGGRLLAGLAAGAGLLLGGWGFGHYPAGRGLVTPSRSRAWAAIPDLTSTPPGALPASSEHRVVAAVFRLLAACRLGAGSAAPSPAQPPLPRPTPGLARLLHSQLPAQLLLAGGLPRQLCASPELVARLSQHAGLQAQLGFQQQAAHLGGAAGLASLGQLGSGSSWPASLATASLRMHRRRTALSPLGASSTPALPPVSRVSTTLPLWAGGGYRATWYGAVQVSRGAGLGWCRPTARRSVRRSVRRWALNGGSASWVSPAQRPLRRGFCWAMLGASSQRLTQELYGTTMAFGPQHPAAHGILKLALQVRGEVLHRAEPQFGFLHRGTEKLVEGRSLLQALPYFDRFDYVANLIQEHAFCLSLEVLAPAVARLTAGAVLARTLFDELSRLLNHLLTLSATALDLGAMGPIFWAFEEREGLMALLELASGARMHTGLYRPGGLDSSGLSGLFFRGLSGALARCTRAVGGAFLGLLANRSLRSRLASMGQLSQERARGYGISGLVARSSGFLQDQRFLRLRSYGAYGALAFRTFVGRRGDNLDRFLLRVKEAGEGARVLSQLMQALGGAQMRYGVQAALAQVGTACSAVRQLGHELAAGAGRYRNKFSGMEALIWHFRVASEGYIAERGLAYRAAESPKGEAGVMLLGVGSPRPARVKMRTPVSHNMHTIPTMAVGVMFADFVATFCSLDIVLGEIDR